jgi:hypothetical protein
MPKNGVNLYDLANLPHEFFDFLSFVVFDNDGIARNALALSLTYRQTLNIDASSGKNNGNLVQQPEGVL